MKHKELFETFLHLLVEGEHCSYMGSGSERMGTSQAPFHVCCGCGKGWWGSAGAATTPAHSSSSLDAPHDSDPLVLSENT